MKIFRMTFTADTYGEDFLESGELDLYEEDPEHPCNIRLERQIRIFFDLLDWQTISIGLSGKTFQFA